MVGAARCAAHDRPCWLTLSMLVRREGETLKALLKRLDKAIGRYYDTGEMTDEINPP
jgi:hypothetical protein